MSVPAVDNPRYANRRFDGNLYGFDATAEAWAVNKQSVDLAAWRDTWKSVNTGAGCDDASAAVGPITHVFDRASGRLIVTLPAAVPACGVKTIPAASAADIATDFSGQKRSPAVPPLPGAWADLKPGENTFWVPLPEPGR